jgi:hypothetical protein
LAENKFYTSSCKTNKTGIDDCMLGGAASTVDISWGL